MKTRNAAVPTDRRFTFRIGVNLGDVIIEGDDVFGDGVNIAARLEEIAEPGGICLSEDAYRQVRGKLALHYADGGEQQLKNIAGPVRVYRIDPQSKSGPIARTFAPDRVRRRFGLKLTGAAGLAVIVAVVLWYAVGRQSANIPPPSEAPPSGADSFPIVAVLPFANLTGDDSQEYFADGVTEEVINALGRFNSLRVIGRNAVLQYKGQPPSPKEIFTSLGADYLVEGSVRRADRTVRIGVQVSGTEDGIVIWSDRFEEDLSNLLDLQDAIARRVAGTFAANIARIEGRRSLDQRKPRPDAHDLVLRARAIGPSASRESNRSFRSWMVQAIDKSPDYATAHALLAEGLYSRVVLGWSGFPDRDLSRAEELARRAIALAPDEPDGHRALGRVLAVRAEYSEALNELRRAIEINPSDANALAVWGTVLSFNGVLDRAVEALEQARQYDPTLEAGHLFDLSVAYYLMRRHDDAIRIAEEGLARYPDFDMFYVAAAAAAAQGGLSDLATRYADQVRQRLPFLDFDALGSRFRDPSHPAYLVEGLTMAGLQRR
jgi:TolB-like protein/Tfp pilus assembly protein PilF